MGGRENPLARAEGFPFPPKKANWLGNVAAVGHDVRGLQQAELAVFFGGQHHAAGNEPPDFTGGKVQHGADLLSDEVLRLVVFGKTGKEK